TWDRALWLMTTRDGKPLLEKWESSVEWSRMSALLRGAMHPSAHAIGEALAALAYAGTYFFGRIYIWIALALCFMFRDWAGTDGAKVREGIRRGVFVALVPGAA